MGGVLRLVLEVGASAFVRILSGLEGSSRWVFSDVCSHHRQRVRARVSSLQFGGSLGSEVG